MTYAPFSPLSSSAPPRSRGGRRAPSGLPGYALLLLLALLLTSACTHAPPSPSGSLPVEPGEDVYRQRCGRCHDYVPPRAYDDEQWRGVVARMQPEAGLSDAEAAALLRWLQSHNGP